MFKWITIVLVATVIVGGLVLAWPTYERNSALRRQNDELARRIAAKQAEIDALNVCQERFKKDPDFVERIARQNHRVFPGEYVFMFGGAAAQPAGKARPAGKVR